MKILMIFICIIFVLKLSAIINVPADQPTIQAGIDAAANTDTVLVQSGTYVESINYYGKNITVGSLFLITQDTTYISSTIINGDNNMPVVTFSSSEDTTVVLSGFTISNGYAVYGGGICCLESNPSLDNLTITNNSVYGLYGCGGGIYCEFSNPSLENVTISGNSAAGGYGGFGGGVFCYESSPSFINVTISGNSADYGGGIYCLDNSSPNLVSCILWNDTPEEIYFRGDYDPNAITISYSDIQGGEAGIVTNNNGIVNWLAGNIDEDPLFVDAANGDYHLTVNSPCIDTGDPDLPLDPDGTIADMGAFYFDLSAEIEDYELQVARYLLLNYPNPFNPSTTIEFSIQNDSNVELTIFNIKGQKIKTLTQNEFIKGSHSIIWNGEDASGKKVGSGVYLYKLNVNGKEEAVKKCLLLK